MFLKNHFSPKNPSIMKKKTSKSLKLTKIKIASLSKPQQNYRLATEIDCWSDRRTCASCVLTCTTNLC